MSRLSMASAAAVITAPAVTRRGLHQSRALAVAPPSHARVHPSTATASAPPGDERPISHHQRGGRLSGRTSQ